MTVNPEEDLFGWMQEREIIRLEKALRRIASLPFSVSSADVNYARMLARVALDR